MAICPTRHRQQRQHGTHGGGQAESARPLPRPPPAALGFLVFVTGHPPQVTLPLGNSRPDSGRTSGRAHADTAPWPQQTCPSCMLGLSAPLPLTRPAGEASGGPPPPSCFSGLPPSGGCFPSPEGPAQASPAEAPHAASTFFCVVGSLGKTEDRQSPRGPARGGDGQDRSALLCPALPCEQDRATGGGRRAR